MRLLLQSAMIFFGTLMAAGLLALGEPQPAARSIIQHTAAGTGTVVLAHAAASPQGTARAAR